MFVKHLELFCSACLQGYELTECFVREYVELVTLITGTKFATDKNKSPDTNLHKVQCDQGEKINLVSADMLISLSF